jgi:hypothetical protein
MTAYTSLSAIQEAHTEIVGNASQAQIAELAGAIAASGCNLSDTTERRAAQHILDYWINTYTRLTGRYLTADELVSFND